MLETDLLGIGIKSIVMLSVVLGLLILFLYVMKRFLFRSTVSKGGSALKVLASLYLSPKERVEVIEVFGEKLVLGVSPGNICFLTKLKDDQGVHANELEKR